ncbi:MAG: carboxylating nicotinate-nucleotide diphosphorylase [Planctomycetota bacterium]
MSSTSNLQREVDAVLRLAMAEDIGTGDVTSRLVVPEGSSCRGAFVAREGGVLAGLEVVMRLYALLDAKVAVARHVQSGHAFPAGARIASIEGPAVSVLSGERIALNFLQRMCAIATRTRQYVRAVEGTSAQILDTRKTAPGLRALDKFAVFLGGGHNHRHGLYDMVLIKDNHLALAGKTTEIPSVAWAVRRSREKTRLPIEVEVETLESLREALPEEPHMVLLDNMDLETLKQAVALAGEVCSAQKLRRPLLEASGGITLENVRAVAETGVDRISVGALTHSVTALDIGLELE